jgi:REP-associated tyrosine transposase
MARAPRLEFEGALYCLCARRNRREHIFPNEKDCLPFLALLKESIARYEVEVHAYVLLPSHFHLLALTARSNLSRWMH